LKVNDDSKLWMVLGGEKHALRDAVERSVSVSTWKIAFTLNAQYPAVTITNAARFFFRDRGANL
jgi:hypothetical protein